MDDVASVGCLSCLRIKIIIEYFQRGKINARWSIELNIIYKENY